MAKRIRGVRLTREERPEVRLLISRGSSFEEAAVAARCSKKTVQRLLSSVGGMPGTGPLGSTCQKTTYRRCLYRSFRILFARGVQGLQ